MNYTTYMYIIDMKEVILMIYIILTIIAVLLRRDDDVVLQSGDPRTALPSEARSDLTEGVVDAEGAAAPFNCQDPSLQDRIIL